MDGSNGRKINGEEAGEGEARRIGRRQGIINEKR